MGLLFYPRGGSAFVLRYLTPELERAGWSVSVVVGSLGEAGEQTHATTFFSGLDVHAIDYTEAARSFAAGADATTSLLPMQPSYEDRPGVPDVVLASVPPFRAGHLAAVWEGPLRVAGVEAADVLHLHHLTPQLDAAQRCWPDVPLVVHLHGTELKLIEAIDERAAIADAFGQTLSSMPEDTSALLASDHGLDEQQEAVLHSTRWASWRHGEHWSAHMKQQVHAADHLITVSPQNRATAVRDLGVAPSDVTAIANGVDVTRFRPRPHTAATRRAAFRRALVEDPQGWTEKEPAGALAYEEADLDRLLGPEGDGTVLVYVGRFLGFKRVPLLIRAFARAREGFTRPGSLLVWGGHPGEWEQEHPATVAAEVGDDGIFFAGWRGHDDLPEGLSACSALVVPSVDDPFPQVPLEAMATGLPVVASRSGGLTSMVNLDPDRPTGWFFPPDDGTVLAQLLTTIVNDPDQVAERGANALAHAGSDLSWEGRVPEVEEVYAKAIEAHGRGHHLPFVA
jgi:glycosyltransferase involved in cell wall biosynthesis